MPAKKTPARTLVLILSGTAALALAGCATHDMKDAQYWQRAKVTEATYMHGPKAQQMLNRDISRCVTELREMHRLHGLRRYLPAFKKEYPELPDPHSPEGKLTQWETPQREGYLRAEQIGYDNFETCMNAKGWERVENLPYDIAERSRRDYLRRITGERHETVSRQKAAPEGRRTDGSDYGTLND